MAYTKREEFFARNEYEMCEMFSDLLFMKTEKFAPSLNDDPDRIDLNNEDIALLDKTGVLNRIFRKWMGTTWLNDGNSKHFAGATPRQELSVLYPDLEIGRDFISAKLERNKDGSWAIVPAYFSKKALKDGGGSAIEMGLKNLKKGGQGGLIEPQLDCEFEAFIGLLELMEKSGRSKIDYGDEFTRYISLALTAAPAHIILNSGLKLGENEFMKIVPEVSNYLNWLFTNQKKDNDDFFDFDDIFKELWGILRITNKNLGAYREIAAMDDKTKTKLLRQSAAFKETAEIFYRTGIAFDRYFLFPLDRYFGGVECVWTSKETFMNQMGFTVDILKSNLDPKRDLKKEKAYLDIGDTLFDLRYNWFAPPTAFRFLEVLYEE